MSGTVHQWIPPKLNGVTGKWEVRVLDAEENLIQVFEYGSLEDAEADMKKQFIDHLLNQ